MTDDARYPSIVKRDLYWGNIGCYQIKLDKSFVFPGECPLEKSMDLFKALCLGARGVGIEGGSYGLWTMASRASGIWLKVRISLSSP